MMAVELESSRVEQSRAKCRLCLQWWEQRDLRMKFSRRLGMQQPTRCGDSGIASSPANQTSRETTAVAERYRCLHRLDHLSHDFMGDVT